MPTGTDFLSSPIEYLKGVGPTKGELLKQEFGIHTFRDLLHDFPFRYIDKTKFHKIRDIHPQMDTVQVKGSFSHLEEVTTGKRKRLVGLFRDDTGAIEVVWFQGIRWIREFVRVNQRHVLYGKVNVFQKRISLVHPEVELEATAEARPNLSPVYRSTEKLNSRGLDSKGRRKLMSMLLQQIKPGDLPENLSQYLIERLKFEDRFTTMKHIHFPPDQEALNRARNRIKFEELFFMQMALLRTRKKRRLSIRGAVFEKVGAAFLEFYEKQLPFQLTDAQKRVVKEIRADLGSGKQMNRLLQGDVGSGKTVVAVMTCLLAIDNGYQACVMAPTEILAQQHFRSFVDYLEPIGIQVGFLSGSVKGKMRKDVLGRLETGELHIMIGTHALIEPKVKFQNLGLSIIDEQHRFGVAQRAKLWRKGTVTPPHVLVMTATPIPRTLAMTLYGDLDVSVIDELPPGRKLIKTLHRREANRMQVVKFMKTQIAAGRQVYVIYPLIEESEKLDLQNLQDGYEELLSYFPKPEYQIGVVHGRMSSEEKDHEMQRFVDRKTQILVSTTVIEVGVDVPNATVMIIENAERFGLSQLHQLRGRVGRGGNQSWCILMTNYALSKQGKERIRMMVQSTNGFEIAEADLRMRGPGEVIGTRQSGTLNFRLVNLAEDTRILQTARAIAERIMDRDPWLEDPKHDPIRKYLAASSIYGKDWSRIS